MTPWCTAHAPPDAATTTPKIEIEHREPQPVAFRLTDGRHKVAPGHKDAAHVATFIARARAAAGS